jgi:hypothetical protein
MKTERALTRFFIRFLMEKEFLHGLIKFRKKPAKQGGDHCFWIPRSFVKNGLIDISKTYEVYLKEVPDAKEPEEEDPKDP